MTNFKSSLEEKRQELERRLKNIAKHGQRPLDKDSSEASTETQNDDVLHGLELEAIDELMHIDAALKRIESGHYDDCAGCGGKISLKRLEANPFSKCCLSCQSDSEAKAAFA